MKVVIFIWGIKDGITQQIPTTGYLKNGMSASNYDKMSIEELEIEGWTDITDVYPFETIEINSMMEFVDMDTETN